jgi:DNA-binding LacI/PurR family transcriptional regulator
MGWRLEMPKITIKEIAKMAGVSPTAVSFVLNNRKGVSDTTRRKVWDVINSAKFIPNKSSRRLSLKKSFNLCLVMNPNSSPFTDFFYLDVTRGIVEQSGQYDYNLILCHLDSTKDGGSQIPSSVTNQDADGLIFLQDTPEELLTEVTALGVPFVLVDAQSNPDNVHTTINPDSERSAYAATEYLIKKGHQDIAFIGSSYLPRYYIQTFAGFKQAMKNHKLRINPRWVFSKAHDEASVCRYVKTLFNRNPIPTAVFCAGDIYAIYAIRFCQQHGYPVPEKLSFISMDDIILSSYITPPLTTIGYNAFNMGKMAADMLIRKIEGEMVDSYVVPSENIIERGSVLAR